MATVDPELKEEEHAPAEEEDTGAQIAPIVRLEEVAVTTGEEDEDALIDLYTLTLSLSPPFFFLI